MEVTEEIKKYTAQVAYAGTINVEVKAKSKEEAAAKAEDICEDMMNMDSEKFLEELEPQRLDLDVQEI